MPLHRERDRRTAPSLTGRIVARLPGVSVYSQVTTWGEPWLFRGTVFDGYEVSEHPRKPIKKVAVAAGSSASFGFRRLLEASLQALPEGVEVTWQTGSTPTDGLPIKARPGIPSEELAAEFAAADVVITHAGVGLSLLALAAGRCPVLVPRHAREGRARGQPSGRSGSRA